MKTSIVVISLLLFTMALCPRVESKEYKRIVKVIRPGNRDLTKQLKPTTNPKAPLPKKTSPPKQSQPKDSKSSSAPKQTKIPGIKQTKPPANKSTKPPNFISYPKKVIFTKGSTKVPSGKGKSTSYPKSSKPPLKSTLNPVNGKGKGSKGGHGSTKIPKKMKSTMSPKKSTVGPKSSKEPTSSKQPKSSKPPYKKTKGPKPKNKSTSAPKSSMPPKSSKPPYQKTKGPAKPKKKATSAPKNREGTIDTSINGSQSSSYKRASVLPVILGFSGFIFLLL